MKECRFVSWILLLSFMFCQFTPANAADDAWIIKATRSKGNLTLKLVAKDPKQQLAVLMQGLNVDIPSENVTVTFPSAPMVKNKMKHHPNEVKAMMRKDKSKEEIRPDLFPLIQALSDTTATIQQKNRKKAKLTRNFNIELDKENAILSFSVTMPISSKVLKKADTLSVEVYSAPGNLSSRKEFTGNRLSKEEGPVKNGLGQASMGMDDKNRTIQFQRTININNK